MERGSPLSADRGGGSILVAGGRAKRPRWGGAGGGAYVSVCICILLYVVVHVGGDWICTCVFGWRLGAVVPAALSVLNRQHPSGFRPPARKLRTRWRPIRSMARGALYL